MVIVACKVTDFPTTVYLNGNITTTIAGMVNDENGQLIESVTTTITTK
jgi:hypothetical protein